MNKYFKFSYLIIAALILVIIFLLTCNKKVVNIPPVTSVPEQIERVRVDSVLSQKIKDSIQIIIDEAKSEIKQLNDFNEDLVKINFQLQSEVDSVFNRDLPDTCKPYQNQVIALQKRLAVSVAQSQSVYNQTIKAKDNIITQKDVLIKKGKDDYSLVRKALDTCFKNQTTLEKALKKSQPKRSIGVGIFGEGAYINPYKFDAGILIYYRGKNGTQFSAGVTTNQRLVVGYSKDIFKFK